MPDQSEPRPRIVITGMGARCALGSGLPALLAAVREGISGAQPYHLPGLGNRAGLACLLPDSPPFGIAAPDPVTALATATITAALQDAGLDLPTLHGRLGLILGTSQGRAPVLSSLLASPSRAVGTWSMVPQAGILNDLARDLPLTWGFTVATACAAGSDAIGLGAMRLRQRLAEVVVCGGVDTVTPLLYSGFAALRALSATACRPFSADRDGIVIGEGAAFIVLETLESAQQRGAAIHAELLGYGSSNDGHHVTYPDPMGSGAERAIRACQADAGLTAAAVDYVNAHGTGTRANDEIELQMLRRLFGERLSRVPVSSSKSMLGHTMGAAGALEAVITVLALEHQFFPPTINFTRPIPGFDDVDVVPNRSRPSQLTVALSTSFAFGGVNACLAFRRAGGGRSAA